MASVEQKCGECKWFQIDTRSPQEVEQLLSQTSGLSVDALGGRRIIMTKSGICLAAGLIQEKEYLITFSSFRCTVKNDAEELQFTLKNPQ